MPRIKPILFLLVLSLSTVFFKAQATPITSMVIFGDSLSDTGNLTTLLKSLKKEEDPSYLVGPLKVYILRKMDESKLPDFILNPGKELVTLFLDKDAAPILAGIIDRLFGMPILPGKPYWNNRYSNGILWGEYLASTLGLDINNPQEHANEAFSGSWTVTNDKKFSFWNLITKTDETLTDLIEGKLIPPSLELEIQSHLMVNKTLDPRKLYFIFTGGNDYMSALNFPDNYNQNTASDYVDNIIASIDASSRRLLDAGARQLAIFTMPDVGLTPRFVNTSDQTILTHIIVAAGKNKIQLTRIERLVHHQVALDF